MAARVGMGDIIEQLRGMTDASPTDFALGTTAYWNDDSMQRVLDNHRQDFSDWDVSPVSFLSAGTTDWREYFLPVQYLEQGTALQVKDTVGAAIGTANFTVDYQRGVITWGSNVLGSSILVCGRYYDLNGAASEIWRFKASHAAKMYDFSTDNHKMSVSQIRQNCIEQAKYYESMAGPNITQMVRADMDMYDVD